MNANRKPVAVVVGATSKWQADGRNTLLAHGKALDDSALPVGVRWGVGGAIAQKFAQEGFVVVLTTRHAGPRLAMATTAGRRARRFFGSLADLVPAHGGPSIHGSISRWTREFCREVGRGWNLFPGPSDGRARDSRS